MPVRQIKAFLRSNPVPDPHTLSRLSVDRRLTVRKIAQRCMRRGGDLISNESIFRDGEVQLLAGADEAGRGALAGPIVAAAVVFPPGISVDGLDDSKELSPEQRTELYGEILSLAHSISLSVVDAGLIDRWGIQMANLKALADAILGLSGCHRVICDYYSPSGCGVPVFGFPKADATFHCVAAASVVAKVERDRLMMALHNRYSPYNFLDNKGYGTEEHLRALDRHGPSNVHRLSFNGVGEQVPERPLW